MKRVVDPLFTVREVDAIMEAVERVLDNHKNGLLRGPDQYDLSNYKPEEVTK